MKNTRHICIFTAMATGIFVWMLFFRDTNETGTNREDADGMATERISGAGAVREKLKKPDATAKKILPKFRMPLRRNPDGAEEDFESPPRPEDVARLEMLYEAVGDVFVRKAPEAFDELMDEEPIDEKWTATVQTAVQKAIDSGTFSGSTFRDVECHRTMCRIRLTHDNKTAKELFMEERVKDDALVGPSHAFSHVGEDGTLQNSVYMGKYGYDYQLEKAGLDRLYEMVTGESADNVVPTENRIAQVATKMGR